MYKRLCSKCSQDFFFWSCLIPLFSVKITQGDEITFVCPSCALGEVPVEIEVDLPEVFSRDEVYEQEREVIEGHMKEVFPVLYGMN